MRSVAVSGFKHVFSSSYKSGHRRGVAILISSTLNFEHVSDQQDDKGRFIKVTGRINSIEITFLNVYIPQVAIGHYISAYLS